MGDIFALNSIGKKLLLILMSVAITAIVIITFTFSAYEYTTAKQEQVDSLNTLEEILSPTITAAVLFDDKDAIQELIDPILIRSDIVSIQVTDIQHNVLASANKVVSNDSHSIRDQLIDTTTIAHELVLDGRRYGYLVIVADDSYIVNKATVYGYFVVGLLIFTLAMSLLLSLILRRRFLKPILHLAKVADDVSHSNDYSLRAKELPNDEVGQLSNRFNDMLKTIEQRDNILETKVKRRTEELETANEQLLELAYKDGLTGLPNRRYFYEKLQGLLLIKDKFFALIFLDLDGFKEVNDTLGHDYGDLLLQQVSKRLKNCVREHDTVARLGGDEFTIILEDVCNKQQLTKIANQIKTTLMDPIVIKSERIQITGSTGITIAPKDGDTLEELIKHADQAMYLAKNKGRNRFEFFCYSIEEQAIKKRQLVEDLKTAIYDSQLTLHYQPILKANEPLITKAEALLRWQHPDKGLLGPSEFIPLAEEYGLIKEIGQWVVNQVVNDALELQQINTDIQISLNTSPLEIDERGKWARNWLQTLANNPIKPGSILIEVTENTLMTPGTSIQQQMQLLSQQGIKFAIDDFGVGYSSLSYLQQLEIDIIKIDHSFVANLETTPSSHALIRAIVTMAHNIGLKVVAEGIENQAQYQTLKDLECDFFQGFLFYRPLSKQEFISHCLRKTYHRNE
ncbi:EAL domain-containing protein [Shewanella sp. WXL01]|uniref:putative bifunctional diguanylate cyclase/phosphodiesterase n=1 Tax=Shewanella sp. WXL01 TaxID=2709721 RepID=UPI0014384EBA|nr:EAL domain-containing protein [Shewanella sp. WXL01]NKF50872.1 EAL domain-containing protein [Shewanella sp. WXL01]